MSAVIIPFPRRTFDRVEYELARTAEDKLPCIAVEYVDASGGRLFLGIAHSVDEALQLGEGWTDDGPEAA